MLNHQPSSVLAFHSCSLQVGLNVLLGFDELKPSNNSWDWLGDGIYLWEQNPERALEYAIECADKKQFNKNPIINPFVLGVILDLQNCLNLTETSSIKILEKSFDSLNEIYKKGNVSLPINKGANRSLDCAVIKHVHFLNNEKNIAQYDTVRGAFPEGDEVYPSCAIRKRTHIQISVRNTDCIKGYFLPKPYGRYNPNLIN